MRGERLWVTGYGFLRSVGAQASKLGVQVTGFGLRVKGFFDSLEQRRAFYARREVRAVS